MIDLSRFHSIQEMKSVFNNEDVCKNTIVKVRWGNNVICPYCGKTHCVIRKDGKFRCNHCKRNFSCKLGTIFQGSKLPFQKWFIALYLYCNQNISSYKLAKEMNVTQKTAWKILQILKKATID